MQTPRHNALFSAAALGAAVIALAGAGGWIARAEVGAPVNAPSSIGERGAPQSFADIVARVAPAVVSINVLEQAAPDAAALSGSGDGGQGQTWPFPDLPFGFRFTVPQGPQTPVPVHASGSGFFISSDGYIVTNNHVVGGAEKITVVTGDNRSLPARVVGADPATDLAVVKVDGGPFPFVSFEDRGQPRVGDWVVAVGNPFGLGGTATAGIVSALGRQDVGESSYVNYMQIDAPINRGNSGGPTFDVEGRVVGVNTAIFTPSGGSVGIGFDIPADVAARVSRQLIASGHVTRGFVGATVQSLSPELAASLGLAADKGALVDQLSPGGPAQAAGLRTGDVVTAVDGRPVGSSTDLTQQVGEVAPGQTVRLTVLRGGRSLDIGVRAGLRPSEASLAASSAPGGASGAGGGAAMLGMQLSPDPDGGLVVQGVAPDSGAADQGLQQGDVLLRAGAEPLGSTADLAGAVRAARSEGRASVPLLVVRAGQRFFVPVPVAPGGEG